MARSATTYILAIAVVAGGAYLHTRNKAKEEGAAPPPALSTVTEIAPRAPEPPAPVPVPTPAPAPVAPAPAPAAPAAPALELPAGDDYAAALALYRLVRERSERAAAERLREIEVAALSCAADANGVGDPAGARAALTVAYLAALDPAARARHRDALEPLTETEFFSMRPSRDADFYTVERGDSLTKIAAKFNFPVEGIQRINKLKGTNLRIGERLKIPRGPVEILVVKADFRMALLCGGRLVKEYRIGTGREGSTPEAEFVIEEKIPEPTWHSKEGVFPFGHPKNILGTRWLGFNDTEEYRGFGIHGTPFPESIGQEVSSGCIRMRNEEVEEVFAFVPRGTRVVITR